MNWRVNPDQNVIQVTLRGICLCYLFANWSVQIQAEGLSGPLGLFPLPLSLQSLSLWVADYPQLASHNQISLLLTQLSIALLKGITLKTHTEISICAALLGLFFPHPIILFYLYASYYATRRVCPEMFSFQWDALLCEAGLYTALLSTTVASQVPYLQHAVLLLLRLLTFRLMIGSGLAKLCSGDLAWRQGTALFYHFLTQPLPNGLSPSLHLLPKEVLKTLCIAAMLIETVVALLSLTCASLSVAAAVCYIALMLGIMMSGSYGFFNLLTIVLCVPLFNMPASAPAVDTLPLALTPLSLAVFSASLLVALLVGNCCAITALLVRTGLLPSTQSSDPLSQSMRAVHAALQSACCCGHYGLFATMTTVRDEIVVELAANSSSPWVPIRWKFKPSHPHPIAAIWPPFHMPRVDWRLWFVALGVARELRSKHGDHKDNLDSSNKGACHLFLPHWVDNLLIGILERHSGLLSLLHSDNPILSRPPSHRKQAKKVENSCEERIRVLLVRYTVPSVAEARASIPREGSSGHPHISPPFVTAYPRPVLPSSSLEDLYLQSQKTGTPSLYGRKVPEAMKPENAAELIQRTLFRKPRAGPAE